MDFTGSIINEFQSLPDFWWVWILIAGLIVWVFTQFVLKNDRAVWIGLVAGYVLFILFETVIGRKVGVRKYELIPFWSYTIKSLRSEVILNYLFFIPLGGLAFGLSKGLRKAVVGGLILSCFIELTQLIFCIGLFEFDDIIGNTIGALIGGVIGWGVLKMMEKIKS